MNNAYTTLSKLFHICGMVLLLSVLLLFFILLIPQVVGAAHSYTVLSSSMEPTLQPGDVVVVTAVSPQDIIEGDIITFDSPTTPSGQSAGDPHVTHRVIETIDTNDGLYFKTKGDANLNPDPELVPAENVIGRVLITIPAVGHILLFAKTTYGWFVLVVIPATVLIMNELYSLLKSDRS